MVGAVLVRDAKIIAEGFHAEFGKAHAEQELVQKFDPTSPRGLRGASQKNCSTDTLYVNLEPCCHTDKKTPPCTDIIMKSGVEHVVFGMRDPNPKVSGKGFAALKKAGVRVTGPVLEDECLRLNRGFVSLQKNHRPWITLKIARTIDGKIANDDRSMMKITNDEQNAWSHEFLRARHDAILVGVGTILTDDSRLTVRREAPPTPTPTSPEGGGETQPYRIVLDATLQIPLTAKIVTDTHVSKTIIVCVPEAESAKKSDLRGRGVQVMECPMQDGIFDFSALWRVLTAPKDFFYGISSILIEGGPKTWESFRGAGMFDEEVTLVGA